MGELTDSAGCFRGWFLFDPNERGVVRWDRSTASGRAVALEAELWAESMFVIRASMEGVTPPPLRFGWNGVGRGWGWGSSRKDNL
jgi:hypothetical protein